MSSPTASGQSPSILDALQQDRIELMPQEGHRPSGLGELEGDDEIDAFAEDAFASLMVEDEATPAVASDASRQMDGGARDTDGVAAGRHSTDLGFGSEQTPGIGQGRDTAFVPRDSGYDVDGFSMRPNRDEEAEGTDRPPSNSFVEQFAAFSPDGRQSWEDDRPTHQSDVEAADDSSVHVGARASEAVAVHDAQAHLQADLAQLRQQLAESQRQLSESQRQLADEQAHWHKERAGLKDEMERVRGSIDFERRARYEAEQLAEKLQHQHDEWARQRTGEYQAQVEAQRSQAHQLERELEELQERRTNEMTVLRREQQKLESELLASRSEASSLRDQLENANAQLDEVQAHAGDASQLAAKLQEANRRIETDQKLLERARRAFSVGMALLDEQRRGHSGE